MESSIFTYNLNDNKNLNNNVNVNENNRLHKIYSEEYIKFNKDNFSCSICFEFYNLVDLKPHIIDCGHTLCNACIDNIFRSQIKKCCPFCNKKLNKLSYKYPINYTYLDLINDYKTKFKVEKLDNYIEISLEEGFYKGQYITKLTNKKVCKNNIIKQGKGKIEYIDGVIYEGYWLNDLKSGYGECYYSDLSIYKGNWVNDQPEGHGTFEFGKGEIKSYSGNWRKGKFFGYGTLTFRNGIKKESVFIDGDSSSECMKIDTGEFVLFGSFDLDTKPKGNLYRIEKYGDIYYGELDEAYNYSNLGSLYKFNGDIYKGHFSNGVMEGNGFLKLNNGDVYQGIFKNWKLEGNGKYISHNGITYEGDFTNNIFDGKGIIKYTNGDSYKGSFKNGYLDGYGEYIYSNGNMYVGDYIKGKKEGKGKLTIIDDFYVYDGEFKNDLKHGYGYELFSNKESYCGQFANDSKNGTGIFVFENGETYKGMWKNNKINGEGIYIKSDGKEVSGIWNNGVKKKSKDCIIF